MSPEKLLRKMLLKIFLKKHAHGGMLSLKYIRRPIEEKMRARKGLNTMKRPYVNVDSSPEFPRATSAL